MKSTVEDPSIHHKNLLPVVYVTGDVAGDAESPAYAILKMNKAIARLGEPVAVHDSTQPSTDAHPAIKWDGEWHLTLELFRDLGAAFGVVLLLIYGLLVGWFRSFSIPGVLMAPIPFSLVGILPAHAALGANFTAPSLIGFMAGAGIVVRNSIILVDFAEDGIRRGLPNRAGRRRRGGRALPADVAHRAGSERWLRGDPLRPHLPGAGAVARCRRGRLTPHQPDGGPGALHDGPQARRRRGRGAAPGRLRHEHPDERRAPADRMMPGRTTCAGTGAHTAGSTGLRRPHASREPDLLRELAEQLAHLVEEALGLRVGLLAGELGELLQQLALLRGQIGGRLHHDAHVLVAAPPPCRCGMPLPLSRKTFPVWVPAGIFIFTFPSSVGTSICAPSAAWVKEMGTSQSTSLSSRTKRGCSLHVDDHVEVARRAAVVARLALAGEPHPGAGVHAGRDLHRER